MCVRRKIHDHEKRDRRKNQAEIPLPASERLSARLSGIARLSSAAICLSALLLSGCGRDQALETFYSEMEDFTVKANQDFQMLSGIDPSSETAVDELLSAMDSLSDTFEMLADISVPKEFASIEELADEASSYMTEAASLYHEAYADGGYSESIAATAQENYDRAVMRMNIISEVLQGETPTEASVTVTTEADG
ncbi:MAG TPA: hypothetical protein H9717_08580 [Candidatus Eisenbergiella merdipullorum]|uniref:Uncharacterized protein n=1 Tax=Candidatus Eisenbergiella merdipullorum TaxID=2838553 RepID=A0A9D2L096_9FIRM|nr:hypothetical protein [Candidatus Eisenbergiella merdipullorum]